MFSLFVKGNFVDWPVWPFKKEQMNIGTIFPIFQFKYLVPIESIKVYMNPANNDDGCCWIVRIVLHLLDNVVKTNIRQAGHTRSCLCEQVEVRVKHENSDVCICPVYSYQYPNCKCLASNPRRQTAPQTGLYSVISFFTVIIWLLMAGWS